MTADIQGGRREVQSCRLKGGGGSCVQGLRGRGGQRTRLCSLSSNFTHNFALTASTA
jgi:hypothetical protein